MAAVSEEAAGTREAILEAAEALMIEKGYAAVTSRRVAERAGQKSKIVHYYFATMDQLFVALYERAAEQFHERHLRALSSANPLRALWELSIHPQRTRLSQEFIALSNHRDSIRKITARVLEQMHSINTAFISKYLAERGLDPGDYPPIVISQIISGLSRALINEESLGVSPGHAEVHAFAERWLRKLEEMHRIHRVSRPRRRALA
jgi:TetR/AcrR family transcriptional regulator